MGKAIVAKINLLVRRCVRSVSGSTPLNPPASGGRSCLLFAQPSLVARKDVPPGIPLVNSREGIGSLSACGEGRGGVNPKTSFSYNFWRHKVFRRCLQDRSRKAVVTLKSPAHCLQSTSEELTLPSEITVVPQIYGNFSRSISQRRANRNASPSWGGVVLDRLFRNDVIRTKRGECLLIGPERPPGWQRWPPG